MRVLDLLASVIDRTRHKPLISLILLSLLIRVWTTFALWIYYTVLPSWERTNLPFVSDPSIASVEAWNRWDTEHFVRIAIEGYEVEKEVAFMPGLPALMRWGAQMIESRPLGGPWVEATAPSVKNIVVSGMFFSTLASVAAVLSLYQSVPLLTPHFYRGVRADLMLFISLTLVLFTPSFAHLTSLVYILAPSLPTLHAVPYNEPFSAVLTFSGMALFMRRRYFWAAVTWGIGTIFRAQMIVLGIGFFGWEYILRGPKRRTGSFDVLILLKGLPLFLIYSMISVMPFSAFEYYVHRKYCMSSAAKPRPWCSSTLGISYSWVQSHYWNNGLFKYWRPLQIPNFAFAFPVLYYSFLAAYRYYRTNMPSVVSYTFPFLPLSSLPPLPAIAPTQALFAKCSTDLIPFFHLHTFTLLLILFYSHVQIILRLCVVNPVLFWSLAWLIQEDLTRRREGKPSEGLGNKWLIYTLVWGQISILLWALFLPPA